jgi:hypothetical protein
MSSSINSQEAAKTIIPSHLLAKINFCSSVFGYPWLSSCRKGRTLLDYLFTRLQKNMLLSYGPPGLLCLWTPKSRCLWGLSTHCSFIVDAHLVSSLCSGTLFEWTPEPFPHFQHCSGLWQLPAVCRHCSSCLFPGRNWGWPVIPSGWKNWGEGRPLSFQHHFGPVMAVPLRVAQWVFFEIGSLELFPGAGFELQSSWSLPPW